jgi:alpha-L-glutamate ligase-like protein
VWNVVRRYRALRARGVLGINERNAAFVLPTNPRRNYPRVDDKILTKQLAAAAGIPVPPLLAVLSFEHELRHLDARLAGLEEFVLKPAHGAQGNGIVVIVGVDGGRFRRSSGRTVGVAQLRQHVSSVIAGVFSLSGDLDRCLVEARVVTDPRFEPISRFGIPDIRVIVYRGVPAIAMCRLPTAASDGRANLHQGAIAVGLDIATGRAIAAAFRNRPIADHVDTHARIIGFQVPYWTNVLGLAARAADVSGLGYVGVDIVIDATRGPLLLELNARPGLAIQIANREGLLPRLRAIDARANGTAVPWVDRCALACELFARAG